ncbi:unnamed protein product [Cylicocyclus nassatus]|uniref:Putative nuclease HARBI1 n=1 Tax=Cylicocyclus nassatus TaxID=53992 RepID=A0AA36DP79_CYLNA|nr:unnamed protein product [Cylicocyclus nassatus]
MLNLNEFLLEDSASEEDEPERLRLYRDRACPFETLSDVEFRKDFRFTRPVFYELCEMLREDLAHTTVRGTSLTVAQQVAACVHLLGRNAMQADSARLAGCNQSTASRTLRVFLDAVVKLAPRYINWPSAAEQEEIARRIYRKYRLPNIVGMIDGTHVRIVAPRENAVDYINRKRYHSINVGAICDDKFLFRWVSASWPGSAHDSRVFKSSELYKDLRARRKRGCIIGDSAYTAESFLIKVLSQANTVKEQRYNRAICSARVKIEQAFGMLKRQWHILHSECRYDPDTAARITITCVVLRNLANQRHEPLFEDDDDLEVVESDMGEENQEVHTTSGRALIRRIIEEFF